MIKKLNHSFLSFCLAVLSCNFASADESAYKIIDLGLSETDQSEFFALNDNGQVAGCYKLLDQKHYFLWDQENKFMLIDLPETATIVRLNNLRQIAGNYTDAEGFEHGFMWDKEYGFMEIGTLGGKSTHVHDMNNRGEIVGESDTNLVSAANGQNERHAFHFVATTIVDLGTLTGDLGLSGDHSVATSINDLGQVIGTSNTLIPHKRKFLRTNDRPVFWQVQYVDSVGGVTIEHSMEELLPDTDYQTLSLAVNNQGIATFQNDKMDVFCVNLDTKQMISLPFLSSYLAEIQDNGNILLIYRYSPQRHIISLKCKSANANLEDWDSYDHRSVFEIYNKAAFKPWKKDTYNGAVDVNNQGWIIGSAQNIYGETHAVLIVP